MANNLPRPQTRAVQVALTMPDYEEVKTYARARGFTLASVLRMLTHLWCDEQRQERADMAQDAPKARRK